MAIVGRGTVLVAPSFSGMQTKVAKEFSAAGVTGGQAASRSLGSTLSKFGKAGAVAAGSAIAAGLTVSLTKGFGRLVAIENAQAKMRGLGHDTKTVDAIMKNALASVRGTAFGLGEAATTAAGAVAAGIAPGTQLEKVLKSVANAAAASGVSMEEMGAIYNKAASRGKAQNDILGQVAERGIPIYQALAKQMGVTSEEVFTLASKGKISFEQFEQAMTSASGTVASEMGKTFTGSLANTWAAFGRIGANLLSGVFVKLAPALQGATGWLEKLEPVAKRAGEGIGSFIDRGIVAATGLYDLLVKGDFSGKLREAFGWDEDSKAVDVLFRIRDGVEGVMSLFQRKGTGQLAEALGVDQGHFVIGMLQGIRDLVTTDIPNAFKFAGAIARGVFKVLTQQGTGLLAKTLGVEQDHPVIKGLQTLRDVAVTAFTEARGGIRAFGAAWKANDGDVTSSGFPGFMERAAYAVRQVWEAVKDVDFSSWKGFTSSLGEVGSASSSGLESMGSSLAKIAPRLGKVVQEMPKLASSVGTILGAGLKILVSTLGFLADNIDVVVKLLPVLVAGYAGWRLAQVAMTASSQQLQWAQLRMAPVNLANNTLRIIAIALENQQTKARLANTAATTANTGATAANTGAQQAGVLARTRAVATAAAHRVAMIAQTVATNAVTVAQRALNLVLRANPIGLVITAITLLVGTLVVLYKNNETVRRVVDAAWAAIKSGIKGVVDWFTGTAWPWMRDALGSLRDRFVTTKDKVVEAWDAIKSGVSRGWDAIKGVFDKFKSGLNSVRDRFRSIRDSISDVWRGLSNIIARPINAVIDKLNAFLSGLKSALNKIPGVDITGNWQIRKIILDTASGAVGGGPNQMLASGGPVRGYSPHERADNIPAMLTAGEYVLPVRATRSLASRFGPGFLEALRRGLPGFASGGMVGGPRGGALEKGTEWLVGLVKDAGGWVKRKFESLLSGIGTSWPALAGKGAAMSGVDGLARWVRDNLFGGSNTPMTGGQRVNYGGPYGWAPQGLPWQTIWSLIQAVAPEARMTSNHRPGAITASGVPSLHGQGRAVDIVSGNMAATFSKLLPLLKWSQLYYSPMGAAQIGYRDAAVHRMHFDHIHAAMADGGLVKPFVADSGALLSPGLNVLNNKTGDPEPLIRADHPIPLDTATLRAFEDIFRNTLRAALRESVELENRLARAGGGR